jgi:hypothetical protein
MLIQGVALPAVKRQAVIEQWIIVLIVQIES